jgi:hypothetical protein
VLEKPLDQARQPDRHPRAGGFSGAADPRLILDFYDRARLRSLAWITAELPEGSAAQLARMFAGNFKVFETSVDDDVRRAGPKV